MGQGLSGGTLPQIGVPGGQGVGGFGMGSQFGVPGGQCGSSCKRSDGAAAMTALGETSGDGFIIGDAQAAAATRTTHIRYLMHTDATTRASLLANRLAIG